MIASSPSSARAAAIAPSCSPRCTPSAPTAAASAASSLTMKRNARGAAQRAQRVGLVRAQRGIGALVAVLQAARA